MKKLLLLFAVLLTSVGTWAQISTTTINPEKWYYLKCIATDDAHGQGTTVWLSDNGSAFAGKSATPTTFKFVPAEGEGKYYILSFNSNKYIGTTATPSNESEAIIQEEAATTVWTVGTINENGYVYISSYDKYYLNNADGTNNIQLKQHADGVTANNSCSLWYITEATPEVESGKVYRIINKANANKTISEQPDFLLKAINKDENDLSQLWYVEGSNAVGYTLRNVKTADYFDYVDAYYTHWGTTATPKKYYIGKAENSDGDTPAYFYITFNSSAAPNAMASAHYSNERIVRWCWADQDGTKVNASLWKFEEVDIDAAAKMDEAYNTWYSPMPSSITAAQERLRESGYSSTPFALTTDNTTCPAEHNTNKPTIDSSDGGGVAALLDDDNNTFMHTAYKGAYNEPHYIQVDLGENNSAKFITFSYRARHNTQNNNPKTIVVQGSTDGTSYTDIQTLTNLPDGLIDYTSNLVGNGTSYRYFRFVVTATSNNAKYNGYVYFSLAKFRLNTVTVNDAYVRKFNVLRSMSEWINNNSFAAERPADWCLISVNNLQTEIRDLLYGSTLREYPFTLTTDVNNPVCYQILSGRALENNNTPHYFTLKPQNGGKVKLETNTNNNIYSYWFFMEEPTTGMLMVVPFIDESNPLGYITVADQSDKLTNVHSTQNFAGYYYEVIEYAGVEGFPYALKPYGASTNVSNHGGTGNFMGFFNGNNDRGTAVKFELVTTPALEYRALRAAVASAISKRPGSDKIGTMLNGYSTESFEAYNAKITEAEGLYNNVSGTTVEQLNETVSQLNNLYFVLEINQPVDGKFYRLRCADTYNDMKYLQCTQNTDDERFDMISGDEGGKTVNATFCYINGGLVSYVKPMYIGHEGNTASWNMSPVTVLFQAAGSGALGEYNIKLGSRYLYGKNAKSDSGKSDTDVMTSADKGYHWWIEDVTSLPFTFKKAALGFATFNAPVPVELPEDVLAYVAEVDENKTTLHMHRLEGNVVPANTPVMLYNEAAKADDAPDETTIDLEIVAAYTGDEFDDINEKNDFYGTVAAEITPTNENVYSLQKSNSDAVVGFYKKAATTTVGETTTPTTMGGFKAWIKTATSNARAFTIIFDGDDATGLKEALGLENENVEIYDLSGRRLDKPAKGVNVIGGKLVIK